MTSADFPERIFVTGTDTGIGKTLVSSLLLRTLGYRYLKPIQSGIEEETDTALVQRLSGLGAEHFWAESYCTRTPCSPHLSARIDGIEISLEQILADIEQISGPLIVEGAGGLLVPLNNQEFMLDLIRALNYPVILVARSELGTINHTLLSLQALRHAGLEIWGVVMNGPPAPENAEAIEFFGATRILAQIPLLPDLTPASLQQCALEHFGRGHR